MTLEPLRVAYIVKRYPRYSETFIVNEILAHEEAGVNLEIFSLRPPCDTHFQDRIARVRSPVRYLAIDSTKASVFWQALRAAAELLPGVWPALETVQGEKVSDLHQALLLAREVAERRISHLHAHFATEAASVARLAARFAGRTYSFTAHAKDIFHQDASFDDRCRKIADAAAVVTVSDYNLGYLQSTFGAVANRVQRIYNGMDLTQLPYEAPRDRPRCIVSVGRLVEKKGFEVLVDACAILAQQGVDFRCQIIGTGELELPLRRRIQERGVQEHVVMVGPQPQAAVFQLVQQASALAAPCVVGNDGNRDGLPTVLLEAMALGTPCVSTDVTGIPELVRHEETGLLVSQGDPGTLAAALCRLLDESALRVRLAAAARALVEQEFDIRRNTAVMRQMFRWAAKLPPSEAAWQEVG